MPAHASFTSRQNIPRFRPGFTIVELLIVIVVIGILAAITIVAYNGISAKAKIAAVTSDLYNAAQQIKMYQASNASYPTSIDCSATPAANSICLKSSAGNTYAGLYAINSTNPQSFCVAITNGNLNYYADQDRSPAPGICSTVNGIIGWWKFNGDGSDSSGNGNVATITGPTPTTGQSGQTNGAYAMAGGDINLGSPAIFNNLASTGFTYSIWLQRTGTSSYPWPIIMGGQDTHTFYGIRSENYGDQDTFEYGTSPYSGSSFSQLANAPVSMGVWHLATVTYDGSVVRYYFDANLVSAYATALNPTNQYIGFTNWAGTIDDARIFNRPLSANEVSQLYKMVAQ